MQGRKENVTQTHLRCKLRSNLCADSTSLSVAARGMLPDSLSRLGVTAELKAVQL